MVVTEPAAAYAPRKLGERREPSVAGRGSKDTSDTSISFPEIPGISNVKPGKLASAFNEAKRAQQALGIGYDAAGPQVNGAVDFPIAGVDVDDEGKGKKAQKLTGEMMRKLGLNDPKRMVDEHEEGQKRAMNGRGDGDADSPTAESPAAEPPATEPAPAAPFEPPPVARGAACLRCRGRNDRPRSRGGQLGRPLTGGAPVARTGLGALGASRGGGAPSPARAARRPPPPRWPPMKSPKRSSKTSLNALAKSPWPPPPGRPPPPPMPFSNAAWP